VLIKIQEFFREDEPVDTSKIDQVVNRLNRALLVIGAFLLFLISLAVFWEVFSRKVLNVSHEWVGEYCGYTMVMIAFLAAPHALFTGSMTRVDLLANKISPRALKVLSIIILLITLGYLITFFIQSFTLMRNSLMRGYRSATMLRTPLWIPQLTIPAGAMLMILTTLVMLIKTILTKPAEKAPREKLTDDELAQKILKEAIQSDETGAGGRE
jgi:TRAP-type C4-dicarboxylate transport system permease small subunit